MVKFSVIPLWVKVLALALIIGAVWGHGYYRGDKNKQGEWDAAKVVELEERMAAEEVLREQNRVVSGQLQDALSDVRIEYVTVTDRVQAEVSKPIYTNCKIPASGTDVIINNTERLNALRKPAND